MRSVRHLFLLVLEGRVSEVVYEVADLARGGAAKLRRAGVGSTRLARTQGEEKPQAVTVSRMVWVSYRWCLGGSAGGAFPRCPALADALGQDPLLLEDVPRLELRHTSARAPDHWNETSP